MNDGRGKKGKEGPSDHEQGRLAQEVQEERPYHPIRQQQQEQRWCCKDQKQLLEDVDRERTLLGELIDRTGDRNQDDEQRSGERGDLPAAGMAVEHYCKHGVERRRYAQRNQYRWISFPHQSISNQFCASCASRLS